MKVVQINPLLYGSTGKIAVQISKHTNDAGIKCIVAVPKTAENNKNDGPIVFDIESAGNKPSWDGVQVNA